MQRERTTGVNGISLIFYDVKRENIQKINDFLEQEFLRSIYEIILIAEADCAEYLANIQGSRRYLYIEQKESLLVSMNEAILAAEGSYLYFQSLYDSIDIHVLESCCDLLENNNVNVVCFPQGNNAKTYREDKNANVTGIYDVRLEAQFKVGIFNFVMRKREGHLFNEKLAKKGAYLEYFLRAITPDGKFAYLKEGFQQHCETVFDKFSLQDYTEYETLYRCFERILSQSAAGHKYAPEYIQAVIIRALRNVLDEGALIPETFGDGEQEQLRQLLGSIVDAIEIDTIARSRIFDESHICYFLSLRTQKMLTLADKGRFGIYDDEEILSWSGYGFHINVLKYERGVLKIRGCFRNPSSCIIPVHPYVTYNGERIEIETTDSKLSYRGTSQMIANYREYAFEIVCDQRKTYRMWVEVLGQCFPAKLFLNAQIPVNLKRGTAKLVRGRMKCAFEGNALIVKPLTWKERIEEKKRDHRDYRSMYPREAVFRSKIKVKQLLPKKKVYLYVDTLATPGFYEYYLREAEKSDGIKRYYCSSELDEWQSGRTESLAFQSEQHKLLSATAARIMTTSPALRQYNAFEAQAWEFYRDLMDYHLYYVHPADAVEQTSDEFVVGMQSIEGEIQI